MIEQNSIFFLGGPRFRQEADVSDTRAAFGMFQIAERLCFAIGGGVQIAATHFHTESSLGLDRSLPFLKNHRSSLSLLIFAASSVEHLPYNLKAK
jgi:hypothetical protein